MRWTRRRGEHYGRFEYATEETVYLDPLPRWRHLPTEEVRRRVKDLIRDIEREAAAKRRATEKPVLGTETVMEMDPHYRPAKLDRSPAPDFHARHKKTRKAYAWVVAAYREAAERLRAGDRAVDFPEGTFPPGLPFTHSLSRDHPDRRRLRGLLVGVREPPDPQLQLPFTAALADGRSVPDRVEAEGHLAHRPAVQGGQRAREGSERWAGRLEVHGRPPEGSLPTRCPTPHSAGPDYITARCVVILSVASRTSTRIGFISYEMKRPSSVGSTKTV